MKILLGLMFCIVFAGCATPEKKYAHVSTPELQLRRQQCVDFIAAKSNRTEFKFGPPLAMAMMGDGGLQDRIEEKEKIERELLRRYRAGDAEAFLPIFNTKE